MSMTNIESMKQNNAVLWWKGDVSSQNAPKSITSYGDCKQLLPFSGAGIGMFDGTGDYLTLPNRVANGDLDLSTGDFTIECSFNTRNASTTQGIVMLDQESTGSSYLGTGILIYSGSLYLNATNSSSYWLITQNVGSITANIWYHVAVVRIAGVYTVYLNGALVYTNSSYTGTTFHPPNGSYNHIGCIYYSGNGGYGESFNGYISEVRITKGVGKYTANFTPPRRQLESDNNTKLLLHFNRNDTTFVDSSPSAHTITAHGDAKQLCSPCGSGVAYFDGTGDYLSTPAASLSFGSSNFTIECDLLFTSVSTEQTILSSYGILGNPYPAGIYKYCWIPSIGMSFLAGVSDVSTGFYSVYDLPLATWTPVVNTWYHVVFERVGGSACIYINGTKYTLSPRTGFNEFGSKTFGTTSRPHYIGAWDDAGTSTFIHCFTGYLSDLRVLVGVAKYSDSTIPVPTQPFKPDPYTKLLLHMDGVGNAFYDSSDPPGDNGFPILPDGVTITPNGAFTTQKMKDGRNVWKFDGSTNYVSLSDHDAWNVADNDFTICWWENRASSTNQKCTLGRDSSSTYCPYLIGYGNTNIEVYMTSNGSSWDVASGKSLGILTLNTWKHYTITRSGSTFTTYCNGVIVETWTSSGSLYSNSNPLSIGYTQSGVSGTPYSGNIKDLMIFKGKALTQDQIAAIYRETYIY